MKIVTYLDNNGNSKLGLVINGGIADVASHSKQSGIALPDSMTDLLNGGDSAMNDLRKLEVLLSRNEFEPAQVAKLLSPIPNPTSCRDGYAFRQHVAAARRNRGVEMIPEFDQYPIFYFTNHNAVFGEGDIICEADHFDKLDFELEWACVIGKRGKNIPSSEADSYIAGFTIMNDLSARTLQMEEMKLNLGPAKGKDFATTLGPWLVTPDELEDVRVQTPFGFNYKLSMTAKHNGELISEGNTADMTWTFAEIIERASYGVELYPGDVIGSGTVGTGCYLELNGTRSLIAKEKVESYTPVWLRDGDTIELTIDRLGTLTNRMVNSGKDISILAKKKTL